MEPDAWAPGLPGAIAPPFLAGAQRLWLVVNVTWL